MVPVCAHYFLTHSSDSSPLLGSRESSLTCPCWFPCTLPSPLLSASERPFFAVCCARPRAPEGSRESKTGSCPQGAWRQQEDGPDRGNKMRRALGTPEEGGLAGLPREGLSEEVICSFQQSVTVLGTRYTAANKTKGTSTLREFNSCWGASGETTDK